MLALMQGDADHNRVTGANMTPLQPAAALGPSQQRSQMVTYMLCTHLSKPTAAKNLSKAALCELVQWRPGDSPAVVLLLLGQLMTHRTETGLPVSCSSPAPHGVLQC